jgi:hypothetical protein
MREKPVDNRAQALPGKAPRQHGENFTRHDAGFPQPVWTVCGKACG